MIPEQIQLIDTDRLREKVVVQVNSEVQVAQDESHVVIEEFGLAGKACEGVVYYCTK